MPAALRTTCLPLLLVAGCGYDEEYTGLGEGLLVQEEPACTCDCRGGGGEGEGEGGGTLDVDDLTGRLYRFGSLVLTAPITGPLADPLNGYFADEIEADNLHVLLSVTEHAGTTLTFDVGPGESGDDGYRLGDAPSELLCEATGATWTTTTPARLDFPNALLDPPSLPIQELELGGRFDPTGETVSGGTLVGALTEEDAASITLMGTDFATFLTGLSLPPDLDLDGDGTEDAWRFVGTWDAARVAAGGGA